MCVCIVGFIQTIEEGKKDEDYSSGALGNPPY